MKKQEIYDKVCKHLARQKTRAIQGDSFAYRTEDGKRCAVGCLIPYHVWKKEVAGKYNDIGVYSLMKHSPWAKKNLMKSVDLMSELQGAHDDSPNTAEALRAILASIAQGNDIKPGAEQYIRTWKP